MAIAYDTFTDGGNNGGTSTSQSWNHTATGVNRVGVVIVVGDNTTGVDDVTGVTWGGNAMSFITKVGNINLSSTRWMYAYWIAAPPTSSSAIIASASTSHYLLGASASYTGASQTGQVDASTTNQSPIDSVSSLTTSLTTVADNCWTIVFEQGYDSNFAPTAGTGSTLRGNGSAFGYPGIFDSNGVITPAGSYSMTTNRTTIDGITHIMFSIKPPAAAPSDAQEWMTNTVVYRSKTNVNVGY